MTKTIPQLNNLIKDRKFDWVSSDIEKAKWNTEEIGSDYKLFHFDRYISSEDAIKEMEKEGYRAANIHELLLWKDWNDKDLVVALGSVARVGGRRRVSCLGGSASGRGLGLGCWDGGWGAFYRFLAVRNLSSGTPARLEGVEVDFGTSETLTLESAIKMVKEAGYQVSKIM